MDTPALSMSANEKSHQTGQGPRFGMVPFPPETWVLEIGSESYALPVAPSLPLAQSVSAGCPELQAAS